MVKLFDIWFPQARHFEDDLGYALIPILNQCKQWQSDHCFYLKQNYYLWFIFVKIEYKPFPIQLHIEEENTKAIIVQPNIPVHALLKMAPSIETIKIFKLSLPPRKHHKVSDNCEDSMSWHCSMLSVQDT